MPKIHMLKHIIKDDTSQDSRDSLALKKDYFNVDEMTFAQLLSKSVDYAGLLNYYNLDNKIDGNWVDFFVSDEAVLIAMILSIDLDRIEAAFLRDFSTCSEEDIKSCINLLYAYNYSFVKKIDFWLKKIPLNSMGKKIAEVINTRLVDDFHSMGDFVSRFEKHVILKSQKNFTDFHKIWLVKTDQNNRPIFHKSNLRITDPGSKKDFIKTNFYAFFNSIFHFQKIAPDYLAYSLKNGKHNPAPGLYLVFLNLFKTAQDQLNGFTMRYSDFYFHNILKIKPKKAIPDSTYLVFELDGKKNRVLINKGTEFTAGKDGNGNERIYQAENDLFVNNARVDTIFTLCLARDNLVSPETEIGHVSSAGIKQIPALIKDDPEDSLEKKSWALFGHLREGSDKFENARIGFAVASPVLLLKEGTRDVCVTIKYHTPYRITDKMLASGEVANLSGEIHAGLKKLNNKDFGDEKELVNALEKAMASKSMDVCQGVMKKILTLADNSGLLKTLEQIGNVIGTDTKDAFYKIFSRMFNISMTTENGWLDIKEYITLGHVLDTQIERNCFKLRFRIRPEDDAITSYLSKIHGQGYDTDFPVIRFVLNPFSYLYPFSLLEKLVLREIEIDVDVKNVKDLKLYNNFGKLDSNVPFNPFGPLPVVGSYFIIGNYETAIKKISAFKLNLLWGNLPGGEGGFSKYYEAYGMIFDDSLFKADVSVLKNGKWLPKTNERKKVNLFRTIFHENYSEKAGGGISPEITLNTHGDVFIKPPKRIIHDEEFGYSLKSKGGFIKITLTDPDYAFGHKDYPLILSKVLTANSRLKKKQKLFPRPELPYTPLLNSISIDYQAVARVSFKMRQNDEDISENVIHIHPFGKESIFYDGKVKLNRFLPEIDSDGNIYIGLASAKFPAIITFFFHLREDSTRKMGHDILEVKWYYLCSNKWKQLEKAKVVSDTTRGFLTSGIITLDIPDDINMGNTIMPDNLHWIRASSNGNFKELCSFYSIRTQGLVVVNKNSETVFEHLDTGLQAGSINDVVVSIPGLLKICQAADSAGGQLPEDAKEPKTRISERLRHKNRAVTPWDYERLILARFPEIYKVKCFPGMSTEQYKKPHPGRVLIVLIPAIKKSVEGNLKPMVNSLLLGEVKNFLKSLSSEFAVIEVRNPCYGSIQIRCTVRFCAGTYEGYYVNKLSRDISKYLSPWSKTGDYIRFGWSIRRSDLLPFIQALEYIDHVTKFSMLRISEDDKGEFTLFDTVAASSHVCKENNGIITPAYPWSIAIPASRHFIEIMDTLESIDAAVTGIGDLEIGETFIIN